MRNLKIATLDSYITTISESGADAKFMQLSHWGLVEGINPPSYNVGFGHWA